MASLKTMKEKHKQLDKDIQKHYSKYADDEEIREMKKRKLHLKDQINKIEPNVET